MDFEINENKKLIKVRVANEDFVSVPNGVAVIGGGVFANQKKLKKVYIPSTVNEIENEAFNGCVELSDIELPASLKIIGDSAFERCFNLSKINIPNNVKEIGSYAFSSSGIENVILPDFIEKVEAGTFRYSSLKNITFSNRLKTIEMYAFTGCENLEEVKFPLTLNEINNNAFQNCINLRKLSFPDNVEFIGDSSFENCSGVKDLVLPRYLKKIDDYAFYRCSSLDKIIIPDDVKEIGKFSFSKCANVKEIYLGESLEKVGEYAFAENPLIEKVVIKNYRQLNQEGLKNIMLSFDYYYLNEETGDIIVSKKSLDYLDGYKLIDCKKYGDRMKYIPKHEAIKISLIIDPERMNLLSDRDLMFYRDFSYVINKDNVKDIKEALKHDNNWFNKLINKLADKEQYSQFRNNIFYYFDIYKLAYSLGAFNENQIDRQKAGEFLNNAFDKGFFRSYSMHGSFESLKFKGYNKEWAEFFMDKKNFMELIELEKEATGYIARIYNEFEKIKEFGKSSRGNQRYRKVTVEMCKNYFAESNFENVSEDNKDISETISYYTRNQESFDEAVRIRNEYLSLRNSGMIDDYLLNEPLMSELEEIKEDIIKDARETVGTLNKASNELFTYEYLSKYDPRNFVLGKYCSCCAHLEGIGHGIMKASILNPDCQNLVIKDKKGKIIAKSTLYVNREQGYGVFNNVEINNNIQTKEIKKKIYKVYMEAIEDFANRYNEKNPDKPLSVITVGLSMNDLKFEIAANNEESEILNGINFEKYGGYEGNWQGLQYVVWRANETKDKGVKK